MHVGRKMDQRSKHIGHGTEAADRSHAKVQASFQIFFGESPRELGIGR